MPAISLASLLQRLPPDWGLVAQPGATAAPAITGIAEDSRRVGPGTLFLARAGRSSDGHRYIPAAIRAGAAAVAGELPPDALPAGLPPEIPYLQVREGRTAFALLSAAFYDFPSRQMAVVGVTGTDGKTTTSTLIHGIVQAAGRQAGLITTISALIGHESFDTGFHVTTPEAFDLQGYLARMRDAGCTVAVVETTSHALDQARVAYVDYDVAVVTNVTHEHLDWHGSWEGYMAAKARLFAALVTSARKPGVHKTAVLNRDDRSYAYLRDTAADRIYEYTLDDEGSSVRSEGLENLIQNPKLAPSLRSGQALERSEGSKTRPERSERIHNIKASDIRLDRDGTSFMLHTPVGSVPVRLRLLGRYNVANALAAAAAGLALGAPLPAIAAGLGAVARVKGRMEWVYAGPFDVVVDFAHTPNALEETLRLGHALVPPGGRVIAVFGSAGLRDVAKRRLMGEVAGRLADFAVVTAEDPRTEDVDAISAEIAAGLESQGRRRDRDFLVVPDRAEAIATAVRLARPGDLVVTCGKAHEQSMCYGTTETAWDEFAAARAAVASLAALTPRNAL